MKRQFTPEALVSLPILSSSSGLVLSTQLCAVASTQQSQQHDQKLPPAIADALADLELSTQVLSVVKQPVATDSSAKKTADTALDTAWRNLYGPVNAWNNTAAPTNPDPTGTKRLMELLFSEGLAFIRAKYQVQWQESKARLDALAADPSYARTIAALNLRPLFQAVQDAQDAYGVALGITEVTAAPDTTAVRDALSQLCADLRVYALQVAAYACTRAPNAQVLADALLEPLALWVTSESQSSSTSTTASSSSSSASVSTPAATG